jgi:lipoyl-dependent peroxiredoxin
MGGRDGRSRSNDGRLDLMLVRPGAQLQNIALPADTAIDAEVDLYIADGTCFLRARLNVSMPGLARGIAQTLIDGAHATCPYSKATHGNIDVTINLV